ncbi:transposase [Sporomusa termitida]|uniref:Transposase IS200 like protein n=1 Tax=Sporomusa termitida TaxID=2377 RepID=A0A517DY49_9FIRM|nr:transposase [Sporomusa termitida]QDR82166.1 Transposase IS200 like protein [Sporomusa termitida]
MARAARVKSESGIYHIMIIGINKQFIVADEEDHQKFLAVLKECKTVSQYKIYAYCLLGNHIHLLLKTDKEGLEKIFKRIGARYVYYYNWKYKRSGPLFQDRFRSEPVDNDSYILTVLRYIHNHPVAAGLVKSPGQYPWSSYHEYLGRASLVDAEYISGIMNREEFAHFHQQQEPATVLDISAEHLRLTDEEAKIILSEVSGVVDTSAFMGLDAAKRKASLRELRKRGLSIRQISRLTGVSKALVEKK